MNHKSYKACCPVCGRVLLKGKENSDLELFCPKCKTNLNLKFKYDGVIITVIDCYNILVGENEIEKN